MNSLWNVDYNLYFVKLLHLFQFVVSHGLICQEYLGNSSKITSIWKLNFWTFLLVRKYLLWWFLWSFMRHASSDWRSETRNFRWRIWPRKEGLITFLIHFQFLGWVLLFPIKMSILMVYLATLPTPTILTFK